MNARFFLLPRRVAAVWCGLALGVAGCAPSAQQQAYDLAARTELQAAPENTAAVIAAFQQVIALQPDSAWAGKARARIEAAEARRQSDELHKSVFQEHGVD
jgi:hypothetical protein